MLHLNTSVKLSLTHLTRCPLLLGKINILDVALNPDAAAGNFATGAAIGLGVAALGPSAFKMLRLLSSKFRKACNSFSGDTLVHTEDGLKPISEIKIGDKVWAYDEESGETVLQEVVHTIEREGDYLMVHITTESGETIEATEAHPFYVKSGDGWEWRLASEISVDDLIRDNEGNVRRVEIVGIKQFQGKVYNLTVENDHTYFVGEHLLLSHNAGKCSLPDFGTSARNHILRGSISPGGRITGYHHRFGGVDSGLIKVLEVTRKGRGAKGGKGAVYEAWVGFVDNNGKLHRKLSTFFPDDWTTERVVTEINSALISATSKGKLSGTVRAKSASGIIIEIKINAGVVETAYPILR